MGVVRSDITKSKEVTYLENYRNKANAKQKFDASPVKAYEDIDKIKFSTEREEVVKELCQQFIEQVYQQVVEIEEDSEKVVLSSDNLDIIDSKYKVILKEKEVEIMKRKALDSMRKKQINFLIISNTTIIVSLLGLIFYYVKGMYIVHPMIYIITLLIGIGWLATVVTSLIVNKVDKRE